MKEFSITDASCCISALLIVESIVAGFSSIAPLIHLLFFCNKYRCCRWFLNSTGGSFGAQQNSVYHFIYMYYLMGFLPKCFIGKLIIVISSLMQNILESRIRVWMIWGSPGYVTLHGIIEFHVRRRRTNQFIPINNKLSDIAR